jgi:FkbM family methyltransferase
LAIADQPIGNPDHVSGYSVWPNRVFPMPLPVFLRHLPSQFRLVDYVRLAMTEIVRRVLDRHAQLSYSMAGEDLLLQRILGGEPGFYVDVGCNFPDKYSNTFALYKRGWRGVCIDAVPDFVAAHRRLRPRDQQVHAAISNQPGEVSFTWFRDDDQIASLDPERSARNSAARREGVAIRVAARALTDVLVEHAVPAEFDLLSVDVEGHDYQVFQSLDFARFRPRLVVVELLGAGRELGELMQQPVARLLIDAGYQWVGYAYQNGYFADTRSAKFSSMHFG